MLGCSRSSRVGFYVLDFECAVLVPCLQAHGRLVAVRGMPELASLFELKLLRGHILGNRGEESVDE